MKKVGIVFVITIVLFMSWNDVDAQTFTCTIQNQVIVGNQFKFDIYIQTTSGSFYIGNCDFVVTFNNGNFTSPIVSRSINGIFLAGAGDGYIYNMSVSIVDSIKIILNVNAPFWDDQTMFDNYVVQPSETAPGTRVATITVTGITNFAGTANIQWRTTAPNNTAISNTLNVFPWSMTNITANGTFINPSDSPLPVELTSFTSKLLNDKIQLNWVTKTEVSNYGFDIERRINEGEWNKIGFVEGSGNSNSPKKYNFTDTDLIAGGSKFQYRLKQIDSDGKFEYSDVVEVVVLPTKYELSQNYPNPFNPNTTIRFSLPKETDLKINVYNMLGQLVETIAQGIYEAGYYKINFNASSLPSGAYIYRIESSEFTQVRKMILIK